MMLDKPEKRAQLHQLIIDRARTLSLAEWRAVCGSGAWAPASRSRS